MLPTDPTVIDPRLLRVFEALHAHRHVTRAAEQLDLSQPTLSIALGKLRGLFGDPLFVRTSDGMLPTPRADQLIEPVREALESLKRLTMVDAGFTPATSPRRFRIAMTDASHITLLPQILRAVRAAAPGVTLEATRIDARIGAVLQAGEADVALGLIPELDTGFYQQTLFHQGFICLVSPDHPRIGGTISLAQYQAEAHVGIVSGTGQALIDGALSQFGLTRRVVLSVPGFLGLGGLLAGSDLIATLPRHIGETLAALGRLKVLECPFPIPGFDVKLHWHARYHHDAANRWLRGICAGLFLKS